MASKGVKGLNKVIQELRKFGKEAEKIIDAETQAIAFQIEQDAKRLAPKNFGKLAQSISFRKKSSMNYELTVNEFYGGYMEFGTGTKVHIPAEFADMAASFRGNNSGKSFKQGLESIKVWCRAKGIPEEAAYPIFAKILGAGINPQPFLYPAYIKGKKDYLVNLKRALAKFKKKI
jgi:HK97 gp10 family phage protein